MEAARDAINLSMLDYARVGRSSCGRMSAMNGRGRPGQKWDMGGGGSDVSQAGRKAAAGVAWLRRGAARLRVQLCWLAGLAGGLGLGRTVQARKLMRQFSGEIRWTIRGRLINPF
jgi:hypothetical protein